MKQCHHWPISICTWSLHNDLEAIAQLLKRTETGHVHLDLRPACIERNRRWLDDIRRHNWAISATMIGFPQEDYTSLETISRTGGIVPDECWQTNLAIFRRAVAATRQLEVKRLSAHIGFIDHHQPASWRKLLERVGIMADWAGENGVQLLFETGQETAAGLRAFLEELDHPAAGVNFDPANMILYDKDQPLEAIATLAPWVGHVHIKDAIRTQQRGQWGTEVAWGTGQVGADDFLKTLANLNYEGAMAVEREAGNQRQDDIQNAVEQLKQFHF